MKDCRAGAKGVEALQRTKKQNAGAGVFTRGRTARPIFVEYPTKGLQVRCHRT
jgi:hypothetical protein